METCNKKLSLSFSWFKGREFCSARWKLGCISIFTWTSWQSSRLQDKTNLIMWLFSKGAIKDLAWIYVGLCSEVLIFDSYIPCNCLSVVCSLVLRLYSCVQYVILEALAGNNGSLNEIWTLVKVKLRLLCTVAAVYEHQLSASFFVSRVRAEWMPCLSKLALLI